MLITCMTLRIITMHYYKTVMMYFNCMGNIKTVCIVIIKFLPFCFGFNHANNINYTGKVHDVITIYIIVHHMKAILLRR